MLRVTIVGLCLAAGLAPAMAEDAARARADQAVLMVLGIAEACDDHALALDYAKKAYGHAGLSEAAAEARIKEMRAHTTEVEPSDSEIFCRMFMTGFRQGAEKVFAEIRDLASP